MIPSNRSVLAGFVAVAAMAAVPATFLSAQDVKNTAGVPVPALPDFDKSDPAVYGRQLADYADLFDSGWKDSYAVSEHDVVRQQRRLRPAPDGAARAREAGRRQVDRSLPVARRDQGRRGAHPRAPRRRDRRQLALPARDEAHAPHLRRETRPRASRAPSSPTRTSATASCRSTTGASSRRRRSTRPPARRRCMRSRPGRATPTRVTRAS